MVLERPGQPLRLVQRPVPVPSASQVLVRVAACGVCRTDLHVVDGEEHGRAPTLEQGLFHARRMDGVAVRDECAFGEGIPREPERVGVVPVLRPLVEDEFERETVPALQLWEAFRDALGGEAANDRDLLESRRPEVRQHDVEDRPPVREGEQRLRQLGGELAQPSARSGREHDALHRFWAGAGAAVEDPGGSGLSPTGRRSSMTLPARAKAAVFRYDHAIVRRRLAKRLKSSRGAEVPSAAGS